uniref:Chemosensory protein 6 n=1 Tax=Aulacocentrum confusum TaxID=2767324 RepID=A0A7G8Z918_9HYME|nr:chemosensory protein 6 [Aulacocentrum confusum]
MGEGNCTPEGKELKKSLPDALATGCKSCSEKQKTGSEKVIRFLVNEVCHHFLLFIRYCHFHYRSGDVSVHYVFKSC